MAQYAVALSRDILLATKTQWIISPPIVASGTYIYRARNCLFQQFIENPVFEKLMFIDSDLYWEPGAIQKVLETPGDIVGGCYRKKQDEVAYSFWPSANHGPVAEVDNVPGGFMCIGREAAQKIFDLTPKPFNHIIDNNDDLGEDVSFCIRARQLGLQIFARLDIGFQHYGVTFWEGAAMEDLKIPMQGESKCVTK